MTDTAPKPASAGAGAVATPLSCAEYCQQLRDWLWRVQHVQTLQAYFPVWLMQQQMLGQLGSTQQMSTSATTNNNNNTSGGGGNSAGQQNIQQQQQQQQRHRQGVEYHVPAVWKRAMAELFDFILLSVLRVLALLVHSDLINSQHFFLEAMVDISSGRDSLMDFLTSSEISTYLLVMELVHRVMVFLYETVFVSGARLDGNWVGGCTPGKWLLGLRVVRCDWAVPSLDGHIVVWTDDDIGTPAPPAANAPRHPRHPRLVGVWRAMVRSFCKNVSVFACVPVCLTVLVVEHGRAPYDLLAGTVVVEPSRHRRP